VEQFSVGNNNWHSVTLTANFQQVCNCIPLISINISISYFSFYFSDFRNCLRPGAMACFAITMLVWRSSTTFKFRRLRAQLKATVSDPARDLIVACETGHIRTLI
jgi:hypothetical protein